MFMPLIGEGEGALGDVASVKLNLTTALKLVLCAGMPSIALNFETAAVGCLCESTLETPSDMTAYLANELKHHQSI